MNRERVLRLRQDIAAENKIATRDGFLSLIEALLEDDAPKIDRSARGPVEVTTEDGTFLMYAAEWGLFIYKDMAPTVGDCSWEDAERRGCSVRKLTTEDIQ